MKIKKIIDIGIYLFFALLMVICINGKKNYHTDEISTYILSNNTYTSSIAILPQTGHKYIPSDEVWVKSMSVSEGQRFNYKNVWDKQYSDVHPPMYYAVVHTISSLFPGVFSRWFAGAVNIIFALLSLFILRKLTDILYENDLTKFFVSVYFCISAGVLSATTFLRMYIMAMFFTCLITYIFVLFARKRDRRYFIGIFLVSVVGVLTHYYFLIYLFCICLVFGIYLLAKKEWRLAIEFILTMALAGIATVLTFPGIIRHSVGGGYRGTETIESFVSNDLTLFWDRMKWSYNSIDGQLFGGILVVFIVVAIIAVIINRKNIRIEWLLITIPCIMYFVLITKMLPFMSDRYFHPIYPLSILIFVGAVCYVVGKLIKKPQYLFIALSVFLALASLKEWRHNWFYLYRHSQTLIDYAKAHSDLDCVYLMNAGCEVNPSYLEVSEYKSVTFVPAKELNILNDVECNVDNGLIVCVFYTYDDEFVKDAITGRWPQLVNCERIDGYGFANTYYFSTE